MKFRRLKCIHYPNNKYIGVMKVRDYAKNVCWTLHGVVVDQQDNVNLEDTGVAIWDILGDKMNRILAQIVHHLKTRPYIEMY